MFRSKCTFMKELPVEHRRNNLYRCTVHSVVYLINTPTIAHKHTHTHTHTHTYIYIYMVLNMETGNGKVGRIENYKR